MKNTSNILTIITLTFLVFTVDIKAQVVDESISGIQTGYLGVWWYNESRLGKNWAMRYELGYEAPLFTKIQTNIEKIYLNQNQYPLFLPVAALEPRWYYNSKKRQGNSKNTFHNSGSFAAIAVRYYPKFLAYSPKGVNYADGGLFIMHSFGLRRNINYRWNIEFKTGIGIDLIDQDSKNSAIIQDEKNYKNWLLNFTLRIGYKYGITE